MSDTNENNLVVAIAMFPDDILHPAHIEDDAHVEHGQVINFQDSGIWPTIAAEMEADAALAVALVGVDVDMPDLAVPHADVAYDGTYGEDIGMGYVSHDDIDREDYDREDYVGDFNVSDYALSPRNVTSDIYEIDFPQGEEDSDEEDVEVHEYNVDDYWENQQEMADDHDAYVEYLAEIAAAAATAGAAADIVNS